MRRWPLFALALSMMPCTEAAAQDRDRAFTSGLSVGLGVGHENSGLGGHALYYVQLSERWRIAPHVGVGWVIGATGVAGGVMATFGRRSRLVLDLLGGPMAASGGTGMRTQLDYGVALLVGVEWMSLDGLVLRSSIGPSYQPPGSYRDNFFFAIQFLSVDYKLW